MPFHLRKKPARIDYKKELEDAARSMILVHEPDTLIKMIVRRIAAVVNVDHAGILLHNKERNSYILTFSRGSAGVKIPKNFARMDADNPLIRFFNERIDKQLFNDGGIVYDEAKVFLKRKIGAQAKELLKGALYQMEIFDTVACVPSYFGDELLGLLLLGNKKNGRKFQEEEIDFFDALASDVAMALKNAQLFEDLKLELEKNHRLFIHTTVALAAAIDAKDHYTHGHTSRVTNLSLEIARALSEHNKSAFNEKFLENLHIAGLLHDIGKIGISESILNKEGPLNEAEKKRMQEHPLVGEAILLPIRELQESMLGVKYHHEKYDGSGYPEGLKGNQIPLIASIISVADTFDAMTTDRPYRKGLSKKEAADEIERQSGKQFDPLIVNAFAHVFHEGKI
ncbi:MAG: HD domain-containing protein [Candidatus Omnitrophica bacterium]|nr:HD domain-containing protein [Candidatus Omnitrophota bacterium]